MNPNFQLILGGARSGKSRFSLSQGNEDAFERRLFVATATAGDEEMKERIRKHQADRGSQWETLEAPYQLTEILQKIKGDGRTLIVVDCATLWLSNLLCGMGGATLSPEEIEKKIDALTSFLSKAPFQVRVVSNEVGLSIVPETLLGRQFRDLQGLLNQRLAAEAGEVHFFIAGLGQKLK